MKLKLKKNLLDNNFNLYELVNQKNAIEPNYELNKQQFSFEIYINHLGDLCIIKRIDNNYICGLSFSTVSDLVRTQAILNGMIETSNPLISTEYNVLGYRIDRSEWYQIRISHTMQDGELWFSILGDISRDVSSRFQLSNFAQQLQLVFSILISICDSRLADGLYIPVLKSYHILLSKFERNDFEAPAYYHQMKPLIEVIRKESYVKLASNAEVRELYFSILRAIDNLYGAFMDKAR